MFECSFPQTLWAYGNIKKILYVHLNLHFTVISEQIIFNIPTKNINMCAHTQMLFIVLLTHS